MKSQSALSAVQLDDHGLDFVEVCRLIAIDLGVDTPEAVFEEPLPEADIGYVSVCLLRMFGEQTPEEKRAMLYASWSFLDRHLQPTYKHLEIDPGDQTFEKEEKLRQVLPRLESELSAIARAVHIESMPRSRAKTLQAISYRWLQR